MNSFKGHQLTTGSGMIELKNGIVTIKDEFLENKILMEVADYGFPPVININTPVLVNTSDLYESHQLVLSCSIDYYHGVTINHFQGSITDEDGNEYKFYLSSKLQSSIESSIFSEYNYEMF